MIYFLTNHEDLEEKRQQLSSRLKCPVYIASCGYKSGTHYRRPGQTEYAPLGRLEMFLSTWTDDGRCVKREPIDDNQRHDNYYFDLREADRLYLIYPREDMKAGDDEFRSVGVPKGLSSSSTVIPTFGEPLPEELKPYLQPIKQRCEPREDRRMGLHFQMSAPIERPAVKHETWYRGLRVQGKYGEPFVTLHAPAQYSGHPVGSIEAINRYAIIDMDPGPCAVCHGRLGIRRHIAPLQSSGPDSYLAGYLCTVCAKEAFAQWSAMLDDPAPI